MRGYLSGATGRRGLQIEGVAWEEYRGRKEEPGMGPRGQVWWQQRLKRGGAASLVGAGHEAILNLCRTKSFIRRVLRTAIWETQIGDKTEREGQKP